MEVLKSKKSRLQTLTYEEIPHGRVIYNYHNHKTTIFMDAKLFKKGIAQQIALFFEVDVDSVILKKDPHYQTTTLDIKKPHG